MSEQDKPALAFIHIKSGGAGKQPIYPLSRFPAYIGADEKCDVVLNGPDKGSVAGKHAQLLLLPNGQFRVINLATQPISLQSASTKTTKTIAPRQLGDLASGDSIVIGTYALSVSSSGELPAASPQEHVGQIYEPRRRPSSLIGLRLVPSQRQLDRGGKVVISTFITNKGNAENVKFEVAVVGIDDAAFYEADEGPTLNPGPEKGVQVTIKQPMEATANKLPAGEMRVGIRVTAVPYTSQPAEDFVEIDVLPIYLFDLKEEGQ